MSSLTRGLVGDTSFAILPEITSRLTFIITLTSQLVCPALSLLILAADFKDGVETDVQFIPRECDGLRIR
jgi:hypothetical protein